MYIYISIYIYMYASLLTGIYGVRDIVLCSWFQALGRNNRSSVLLGVVYVQLVFGICCFVDLLGLLPRKACWSSRKPPLPNMALISVATNCSMCHNHNM